MVDEVDADADHELGGLAGTQVLRHLGDDEVLEPVAVQVERGVGVEAAGPERLRAVPAGERVGEVVRDRDPGAQLLGPVDEHLGPLADPATSCRLEGGPRRVGPVHGAGDLDAVLGAQPVAARGARADREEEDHVQPDAVELVAGQDLLHDPELVLAVLGVVGAAHAVAGAVVQRPAREHVDLRPLGVRGRRPVVERDALVGHRGDAAGPQGVVQLAERVATGQVAVRPTDPRRVGAQAHVRLRVDHHRVEPGVGALLGEAVRVVVGQEPRVPVRDVHVPQEPVRVLLEHRGCVTDWGHRRLLRIGPAATGELDRRAYGRPTSPAMVLIDPMTWHCSAA